MVGVHWHTVNCLRQCGGHRQHTEPARVFLITACGDDLQLESAVALRTLIFDCSSGCDGCSQGCKDGREVHDDRLTDMDVIYRRDFACDEDE